MMTLIIACNWLWREIPRSARSFAVLAGFAKFDGQERPRQTRRRARDLLLVESDGSNFNVVYLPEKRARRLERRSTETTETGIRRRCVVKKELFDELLQSVKEAAAIEGGKMKPSRQFKMKTGADVAAVRTKMGLSQSKFAALLSISEDTLQNWEQGRRKPTGPAKVLLKVAALHPEALLDSAA
jgi:putative transcriptional regulator